MSPLTPEDLDRTLSAAVRRPRENDEPPPGWADAVLARVPAPHALRLQPTEVLGWCMAWLALLALAAGVLLMTHAEWGAWHSVLADWDGAWPWIGLALAGLMFGRPWRRHPFTL